MNTAAQRIRIELPRRSPAAPSRPSQSIATTELFELNAGAAHARQALSVPQPSAKNRKPPTHSVKVGGFEIPIYREKDSRYKIVWYEGTQRKATRRTLLEDAKKLAGIKATALANGDIYAAGMDQRDRACFARILDLLAPTGKAPELACADYAMQICKLKTANLHTSLETIVDEYISRASRTKIVPINCPELADQFITAKEANAFGDRHAGAKWIRVLKAQLKKFKIAFPCPVTHLTAAKIKAWLNSIPGSPFTRKGYRTAISGLVSYAKAEHFLPKDWDELSEVPVPKVGRIKKSLLTPEEMIKLLHGAQCRGWSDKMVPFLACAAFAGVRHEEMNPEDTAKVPLDWRDIGSKYIHIGPETAKNPGEERYIEMPANLIAWLAPYRRRSGPLCTTANTSNALTRIKQNAKVKFRKGETRNALRKSWETYSKAFKEDPEQLAGLALEAGHSQSVGRRHYTSATYREEADRWFAILPMDTEGVLPLDFRASA